jgi:GntR family transcriptional regulator/MocR family aminotransferase
MWFWLGFGMIFQQSGAIIKTIPIDEQGLDVDYTRFFKGQFAVFIFVNRDYPTVSLTAERRLKLLQEYQFAIIEDDYDYDSV